MNTYTIDVTAIVHDMLRGSIEVEAQTREEAIERARELHQAGKINLEFSQQVDGEPTEFEVIDGPEDLAPAVEEHTGGEWVLGEPIWIEDERHYNRGGQRFVPVESVIPTIPAGAIGRKYCTVALVLADEDDPECEPNARLIKAAPKMLAELRKAVAYCNSLNGTGPTGEGARSPDGDDFNKAMDFVEAAIAAYEEGGAS